MEYNETEVDEVESEELEEVEDGEAEDDFDGEDANDVVEIDWFGEPTDYWGAPTNLL